LFFVQRSILENFQFSPLKDLEKNNQTGLIRLTDRHQLGHTEFGKRLESFEKAIISYFRSRNEDNLKKPIPAINTNSKTRISSFDVVRPSNTFPEPYGTSWTTDVNDYIHLQDAHSGYHPNETNSFSINIINPTLSRGTYPHRYQDFRGQFIYYDDGYGNDHASSPGEISF
jgi:hypothetical protein